MKNRIISSLIGIPIIFSLIIWNIIGLLALCSIISFISAYEIYKMLILKKQTKLKKSIILVNIILTTLVPLIFSILFINFWDVSYSLLISVYVLITSLCILIFVTALPYNNEIFLKIGFWKFWIYSAFIGFGIAHFPLLYHLESYGLELTLILISLTFTFDVFALFIGRKFGKTKIFPKISPNKSLQGYLGGLFSLFPMLYFLQTVFNISIMLHISIMVIILISFSSLLGDLYESYMKRKAEIKDSGSIIPGHGGILDRTDSILMNVIVFYWLVIWLKI
ncbi:MAG: phosphatidate cytidylyltransferase [Dehalococcoidia bacterium]